MRRILLRGGHAVTGVGRQDLLGADVLIDGTTITAVGPGLAIPPDAEVIDATGRVVMPGLIDSHRHVWQGAIGGAGGKVSLGGYFGVVLAGLLDKYRPEDVYAGARGALQAINAGVTTVADWSHIVTTPAHADENVRALLDSGIRAVFLYGPPVGQGLEKWFFESTEHHPADARRMRAEVLSDDEARITMGLALRGPEFSTPEITAADIRLARELAVPGSMHSGLPGYLAKYDTIDVLERTGSLGPDIHHVHGARFTDDDLRHIAATGGHLTPCPTVDMQMAMGTFPMIGRALAQGLEPALAPTRSPERAPICSPRCGPGSPPSGPVPTRPPSTATNRPRRSISTIGTMLRLATTAGAAPWNLGDRVGTLEVGKRADVILVDVTRPH